MVQCSTLSYFIRHVDEENVGNAITLLNRGEINDTDFDVTFLGKRRREYGEVFNENMLHLLENFACPASNPAAPLDEQTPDTSLTIQRSQSSLLENPTHGQFWYNTSVNRIYYCAVKVEQQTLPSGLIDITKTKKWIPLSLTGDVAGNSGQLAHGCVIPKPVNPITGVPFEYDECSWVVAPSSYPSEIRHMVCKTIFNSNDDLEVVMEYILENETARIPGIVNYQIIAIRDNNNFGTIISPTMPLI